MIEKLTPYKVRVLREGVAAFNARWPGSNLRSTRSYWFEFDMNRSLVDVDVPEHDDGDAALALAEDCERFLFDDVTPEWASWTAPGICVGFTFDGGN